MGQGSFTALPQILTEELECDWAFVKPEYASANRNLRENKVYGSLATGGSRAVRETGELVQQAGAAAQEDALVRLRQAPVRRAEGGVDETCTNTAMVRGVASDWSTTRRMELGKPSPSWAPCDNAE
jgi:hypothetical protein